MTVDEGFAMLGTANFDIRSFYLNFELNLLSYDEDLNGMLRSYQTTCIRQSKEIDPEAWRSRGILRKGRSGPRVRARAVDRLRGAGRVQRRPAMQG